MDSGQYARESGKVGGFRNISVGSAHANANLCTRYRWDFSQVFYIYVQYSTCSRQRTSQLVESSRKQIIYTQVFTYLGRTNAYVLYSYMHIQRSRVCLLGIYPPRAPDQIPPKQRSRYPYTYVSISIAMPRTWGSKYIDKVLLTHDIYFSRKMWGFLIEL